MKTVPPLVRLQVDGGPVPLLTSLRDSGHALAADCGGRGTCGSCRITLPHQGGVTRPSPAEQDSLTREELASGTRLACQVRPTGPGEIRVALEKGPSAPWDPETQTGETHFPVKPWGGRNLIRRQGPGLPPDPKDRVFSLAALHQVEAIPDEETRITLITEDKVVTAILAGHHPRALGVAADLGTTSLEIYLCDLNTGAVIARAMGANPQAGFGADVISRIHHATASRKNLKQLQQVLAGEVNRLIARTLERAQAKALDIDHVCLAGNPTLQCLMAGISPKSIGTAPYRPPVKGPMTARAGDLGLEMRRSVPIRFLPMPSAFIGGDAVAAALNLDPPGAQETMLMVDLGTNGEILLIQDKKIIAASAATGPAFEGAAISCGSRAVPGAVTQVQWDPKRANFRLTRMPGYRNSHIPGLCGSGLIDAVAQAVQAGLVRADGRIRDLGPCIGREEGQKFIRLSPAVPGGKELRLTQKDIRQLQMGKAALRAALDMVLKAAGNPCLTRTVFTGAFGAGFNWRSALALGMVSPAVGRGAVEILAHGAGMGAVQALLSRDAWNRGRELARKTRSLDLGRDPGFSENFARAACLGPHS